MHNRIVRLSAVASTCFALLFAVVAGQAHAAPSSKVTNGKPASSAAFNARWGFVVSVQFVYPTAKPNDLDQHNCGGSLIAPDLVLTAEHCTPASLKTLPITSMKLQVLAKHRTLKAGAVTKVDRVDVVDIWHYGIPSDGESLPQHDVAILQLARPIDAPTIRLVGASERGLWGGGSGLKTGAMVGGWGISVTDPDSDRYWDEDLPEPTTEPQLREVGIPLIADRVCQSSNSRMYRDAVDFDPTTMLCAGALDSDKGEKSNRRGACFGDSGGPLIVPDGVGGWRLAGVVSWGPDHGGGCNSFSIFARVDAMRDWIESVIASNGPAVSARAPMTLAATPRGINALHVTWNPGAGAAPAHVQLIREYSLRDAFTDLGREPMDLSEYPAEVRAEIKALMKARENLTLGIGGPDTRSMIALGVAPRRSSQNKLVRLRLAVEGRDGVTDVSPDLLVPAPIDDTAPARPQAPRTIGTQRGAVKLWWHKVRDNDCVRRYVVQMRPAGTTKWRNRSARAAGSCPDLYAKLSGQSDDWSREVSTLMGRIFGRPNDFRATRIAAGTYQFRIVAVDRAGNRSVSTPSTVKIPKTITAKADRLTSREYFNMLDDVFDALSGDDDSDDIDEDEEEEEESVRRSTPGSRVASVTLGGF